METWNKIEPNVWKPEKAGDEIVGVLIHSEATGKFDNTAYHLEVKEGDEIKQFVVFGTTVLNDRMKYVKNGQRVKITFKGLVKNSKGQDTKIFEVYTAQDYAQDNPETII